MTVQRLQIPLLPGWRERENSATVREFIHGEPSSYGAVLQVSRIDDADFFAAAEDLGAMTAEFGRRLEDWGRLLNHKQGTCSLGRYGFAMFAGDQAPSMFLWITLSQTSAYFWTFLGPEVQVSSVTDAVTMVMSATEEP